MKTSESPTGLDRCSLFGKPCGTQCRTDAAGASGSGGTSTTLNTGAFDPAAEIIDKAHSSGAWVHVDGALGLRAAASPNYAHLVAGLSEADSWSTVSFGDNSYTRQVIERAQEDGTCWCGPTEWHGRMAMCIGVSSSTTSEWDAERCAAVISRAASVGKLGELLHHE